MGVHRLDEGRAIAKTSNKPKVVAQWNKNKRDVVRVMLDEYGGHDLISIRVWYRNDGELRPSPKGISMEVVHLPKLVKAIKKANKIHKARQT